MSEGYVKTYEDQSDSSLINIVKTISQMWLNAHITRPARREKKYLRFISVYQKNGARKHRCEDVQFTISLGKESNYPESA